MTNNQESFSAYGRQLPEGSTWSTAKTSFVSVIGQILFLIIFVILKSLKISIIIFIHNIIPFLPSFPLLSSLTLFVKIPVLVFTHIPVNIYIIPFPFVKSILVLFLIIMITCLQRIGARMRLRTRLTSPRSDVQSALDTSSQITL